MEKTTNIGFARTSLGPTSRWLQEGAADAAHALDEDSSDPTSIIDKSQTFVQRCNQAFLAGLFTMVSTAAHPSTGSGWQSVAFVHVRNNAG
jgi:hypothetical protein